MNITETSYIIKGINKIDLSATEAIENNVKKSYLYRTLSFPTKLIQPVIEKVSKSSIIANNIDHLILANLFLLIVAISFSPTVYLGLLIGSGLLLTLLKWFIVPNEGHNFTTFDIPICAYIGVAIICVAFSSYFMPSAKGLAKLLTYFVSYLICTNLFKGKSWKIYFILIAIAITGGIEAFYGISQKFFGIEALATWQDPDSIKAGRIMSRVYGSLLPYNPNLLAGYLLPVFPISLGLGSIFAFKKKWHWSTIFWIVSLAILACIVFTGSRGAYIGVVFMGIATYMAAGHLIWHNFNHNKYSKYLKIGWAVAGIGAIAVIILGILAVPALQDRIMSIFTLRGNSSNSFRMNVYMASFEMFKDNWLIGIGIGNTTFRLVYGYYMITGFDALGAYSVPLEIAIEMGIIGLFVFLWLLLVITSNALQTFEANHSIEVKLIIASILIAFIGIAGQGLFDTIWYRPQVHIIFWLLVAILSCIISRKVIFEESEDSTKS